MWGALSDERTGLSFTMYNVQYILHVIALIYIHGFCQSRLNTGNHVLPLVASAYDYGEKIQNKETYYLVLGITTRGYAVA
jgi:hypothetical protein